MLRRMPFAVLAGLFALAQGGMAFSFCRSVVTGQLAISKAANAPECLYIILVGACSVVPETIGSTVLAWVILRGNATALRNQ